MARVLVAVVFLLALELPVLAQDEVDTDQAQRIEKLIGQLGSPDNASGFAAARSLAKIGAPAVPALIATLDDPTEWVRRRAEYALEEIGPGAAPAVPALVKALDDSWEWARVGAACALGEIGPAAAPAVPALIKTLDDPEVRVRGFAAGALLKIGTDLKKKGTLLWWVVPRVYWKQLVGLVLLLIGWFVLAGRFPRHRPTSPVKHLALIALTAAVPVAPACSAVYYAVTREWAQGFLPDMPITQLPLPVAAVLSVGFCTALAAVWTCWRKPVAVEPALSEPLTP